jgi:hypothetical protein
MSFASLDEQGHSEVEWDTDDPISIEAARKKFQDLTRSGRVAFELDDSGKKGRKLTEFDPKVRRMVVTRVPVGG